MQVIAIRSSGYYLSVLLYYSTKHTFCYYFIFLVSLNETIAHLTMPLSTKDGQQGTASSYYKYAGSCYLHGYHGPYPYK